GTGNAPHEGLTARAQPSRRAGLVMTLLLKNYDSPHRKQRGVVEGGCANICRCPVSFGLIVDFWLSIHWTWRVCSPLPPFIVRRSSACIGPRPICSGKRCSS